MKLEDGCCTCFSNSSFKSASVLRLSMRTCMSEGDREEEEGKEEEEKEEEEKEEEEEKKAETERRRE